MLELYHFSQSTCSLKVRICLAEKDLEWVDHRLISRNHDHLSDWYLKLNPNGVVPTLIHDGRPVFESSVIIQFIDQIHTKPSLIPADAYGQAQMRSWLAFVDLVTTPAVRYPSFQFGGLLLKFQNMSDEDFNAKTVSRPIKSAFYKKMDKMRGFSDADIAESLQDLRKTAARMDGLLEEHGGPWLFGDSYTLADIAVAPLLDRMEDLGFEALWEDDYPRVAEWLQRMQERPAYRKAYYHGSRLSELYPELKLGRGIHRHLLQGEAGESAWTLRYPATAR
jgi:glutathione S-transferase